MCFRDFSKPWYNDRATALCVNALESLIGDKPTDFFNGNNKNDISSKCVEIGSIYSIQINYSTSIEIVCKELQKLIDGLVSNGHLTLGQIESRYNSLLNLPFPNH